MARPRRNLPTNEPRVLVIEDDSGLNDLLCEEFAEAGMKVESASTAEEGLSLLSSSHTDLVLCDIRLPGMDGLSFLEHAKSAPRPPAVLLITAFGTVSQAVEALKAGADDFLTKPLDLDHLMVAVRRILERRCLEEEVEGLRALLDDGSFHGLLGSSRAMRDVCDQVRRVAAGKGPVIVVGESGTGKELVTSAIHKESERKDGPYLVINCAGIPPQLLESEFFGHAAGAFTGANRARRGLFSEAEGGTLVLDEIGEMPLDLQAKLLRVLQEGKVRPVGANREERVDVRIIASTNRNLEEELKEGRFREDLFYRLETFTLTVPPLRVRGEDIEILAGRFLHRFRIALDKNVTSISPAAMEALRRYSFPGNVRELHNAIERSVTFATGNTVTLEALPARIRSRRKSPLAAPSVDNDSAEFFHACRKPPGSVEHGDSLVSSLLAESLLDGDGLPSLSEIERWYIRYVLERTGGNKRRAAALLGIGRRTLYRHLEECP